MNLSPSLMCADPGHFAEEIAFLEAAGADSFHIDIMDGEFVSNFALSWAEVAKFSTMTSLPLEAHLMVRNLSVHIGFAASSGVRLVYLHAEHPDVLCGLKRARMLGLQAGLAVNPETDVNILRPFADMVDAILMMRVRPGFAGQSAVSNVDARLPLLRSLFPNTPITVDGAVTPDTVASMNRMGASGFSVHHRFLERTNLTEKSFTVFERSHHKKCPLRFGLALRKIISAIPSITLSWINST